MSRLDWTIVNAIRETDPSRPIKEIAVEFGLSYAQCYVILAGQSWKQPGYTPSDRVRVRTKLTWEIVNSIRREVRAGVTQVSLAERYCVTNACINLIVKNRTWVDPDYEIKPARRKRWYAPSERAPS
jgi:hypothetical protein